MQLSLVSTLYYSSDTIDAFINRVTTTAQQITQDYELVLVNDGSPDDSLEKALLARQTDPRIKIIDLSRNFGHHEAGMVGIEQAQGDFVFLIDSDLEEAPELLLTFWDQLQQEQAVDVVYGVQAQRKGKRFEQLSGGLFYTLFNYLSDTKITPNLLTIRLMKRAYVDAVTQYQERSLFVAGIMAHAGFNQKPWVVEKRSKQGTTYTLAKRLKLFLVCITSFSSKILESVFSLGCTLFLVSLVSFFYYGFNYLFWNESITNIKALMLATGFITGSILTCTGLLGFYLSAISKEVKQRPRAIIKTLYPALESNQNAD